ncbi:hypothetical protein ACIGGF_05740 [Rhodococcus sp. NPDC078407]|uniref:hypothetical protein n=1 Tax=Rhodococcus sp. NPDC078407 TaxID=3364509 RepID=UPI0037CB537F
MDVFLALLAVVAAFAVVLGAFVVIARALRSRMRHRRFHGIDSAVGGSAFMGAPREPGVAPPDHGDPHSDTRQIEP